MGEELLFQGLDKQKQTKNRQSTSGHVSLQLSVDVVVVAFFLLFEISFNIFHLLLLSN